MLVTSGNLNTPAPKVFDSSVNSAVTSVTGSILSANGDRTQAIIQNDDKKVTVYLAFGATATVATGLALEPGATYFIEDYFGEVSAITASGTADVQVIEFI